MRMNILTGSMHTSIRWHMYAVNALFCAVCHFLAVISKLNLSKIQCVKKITCNTNDNAYQHKRYKRVCCSVWFSWCDTVHLETSQVLQSSPSFTALMDFFGLGVCNINKKMFFISHSKQELGSICSATTWPLVRTQPLRWMKQDTWTPCSYL